jgi:parallel beta-helix repeat protein
MSKSVAPYEPAGFLSYVHDDDKHENGRITQLREHLSGEVRAQTGEKFEIFQDKPGIAWGQQWKRRVDDCLNEVTFLIPIITPGFLKSTQCRRELERFLEREQHLGRDDIILPIYYINCPSLNEEELRKADLLAEIIAARQYADWRDLRFEPLADPQVRKRLAQLADQIVEALRRGGRNLDKAATASTTENRQPGSVATAEASALEGAEVQSSKMGSGPQDKPEPPTIVVDAMHRGDYPTLQAAVEAAEPGCRILVRPGLYREGIVIDKPVEIIGDGDIGDIVVEAVGANTIAFKTTMGRISNLTLRQAGGGEWFCVDITRGRVDLEGCDISGISLSCVGIHGNADPRLRRNRIHDSNQSGIFVYDNGQGTIEDNEIFANGMAGIQISGGGSPNIRRNRIYSGKLTGVTIRENSRGMIEDNEIFGNENAGIAIFESADPIIRRNHIRDGGASGVSVFAGGQGTLEENEIFRNRTNGVAVGKSSTPAVRRNRIQNNNTGVFVHEGGEGVYEDNEISENVTTGLTVLEGNAVLRRNQIFKNGDVAVRIFKEGRGTFEDNDLRGNLKGPWDVSQASIEEITRKNNQD